MTNSGGGWSEWSKHVLIELKRLNDEVKSSRALSSADSQEIRQKIGDLKTEVGMLKVKAGLWGAVAGMIPVIVLLLLKAFGSGS